MPLNNRLLGQK